MYYTMVLGGTSWKIKNIKIPTLYFYPIYDKKE